MINNKNKEIKGKVIKVKNKSIFVSLLKVKKHFLYKKVIRKNKKVYVHDENNISNINDLVLIKYFKPISKKKSWIITKVLNKK